MRRSCSGGPYFAAAPRSPVSLKPTRRSRVAHPPLRYGARGAMQFPADGRATALRSSGEYRCSGIARRMPGTDRDGGVRGSQTLGRTHIPSPDLSLAPVRIGIEPSGRESRNSIGALLDTPAVTIIRNDPQIAVEADSGPVRAIAGIFHNQMDFSRAHQDRAFGRVGRVMPTSCGC
jgi:hypothetical protein